MFERIFYLAFSPCGSTEDIAKTIAETLAKRLDIKAEKKAFTLSEDRASKIEFTEKDLVVIGAPTYAGKLPNKILPDFKEKLAGGGATAVAFTSFGNRAFDNSLAELCAVLAENGFNICGAAAVCDEHAFAHIGKLDLAEVTDYAEKIYLEKHSVIVPGDAAAPYYVPKQLNGEPAKFLPAKPKTDETKCTNCGLCAASCPMGSISKENVSEVSGICIKCHACVNKCPNQAKYFDDAQLASHIEMLRKNHSEENRSRFFL